VSDLSPQPPATILAALHQRLLEDADRPALLVDRCGGYEWRTWRQIADDVQAAAAALRRVGVAPRDHVALLGGNRYEWLIGDLALQRLGAVSVPVHATLTPAQIAAQLAHADVRWALVVEDSQLARLAAVSAPLCGVILWQPNSSRAPDALPCPVYDLEKRLADETSSDDSLPATAPAAAEPDQLATIIYTSGTTGEPKGVMLSHGNLAFNAWATWTSFGNPRDERRFGLLPWSHAFARTCDLYAWIVSGTQLIVGRSRDSAIADMQATRPTYMNGVPYFFQKVQQAISAQGAASPGAARALLGGHLRACCSGGAPLPQAVFEFYQQQGLPVLEGYGMTEAGPVIATCTERDFRAGSVGRPLRDVEVRIAEDGEVLTRGRHVMLGYYKDAESTAATIRDGWLHTGDLGRLDADGFLHLHGRKKELIVLSTGRKVAPTVLESLLAQDPAIEQVVVVGEGQKELAALVAVNRSRAGEATTDALREQLQRRAAELLQDRPPHEQIRRFAILDRPLSIEAGELSAKQSLRREVIHERYADTIRALFAD